MNIIDQDLKVINVGMSVFRDSLLSQNVETVDVNWKPPCGGDIKLINAVKMVRGKNDVDAANKNAAEKIAQSRPHLAGIEKAIDVIPGMHPNLILHSGPPLEWKNMTPVMREAAAAAVIYEKLAFNKEEAFKFIETGEIEFASANNYNAVSTISGVISASMPVWVVENQTYGNIAYSPVNEGTDKTLASGACAQETIERLCFIRDKFMPVLQKSLTEKIDLIEIMASSLYMGDELHINTKAATALFFQKIVPLIAKTDVLKDNLYEVFSFISTNEKFFLNLALAAAKAALCAAEGIEGSTIITIISSNGAELGIKISGLKGQWFTSSAGYVKGVYLDGFSEAQAGHYIGDEAIIDMFSLGGTSISASSAVTKLIGIPIGETVNYSREMYDICETKNPAFKIPALDFESVPAGFDALKIVELSTSPVISAEINGKTPGVGRIGFGIFRPKLSAFEKIILNLAEKNP